MNTLLSRVRQIVVVLLAVGLLAFFVVLAIRYHVEGRRVTAIGHQLRSTALLYVSGVYSVALQPRGVVVVLHQDGRCTRCSYDAGDAGEGIACSPRCEPTPAVRFRDGMPTHDGEFTVQDYVALRHACHQAWAGEVVAMPRLPASLRLEENGGFMAACQFVAHERPLTETPHLLEPGGGVP